MEADFNCDKNMMKETFTYLNCALQHEELNRKTWKYLEQYERELSKTDVVSVKVVLEFDSSCKKLQTGATVPKGFYKIIETKNKKIKYYFPNNKPKSSNYNDYLIQF
jgi:DNA/RNA endonuclease G (NUC1)